MLFTKTIIVGRLLLMFLRSYSSRPLCDFITVWKNWVLWITIKFRFCLFSLLPLPYWSAALLLSLLKWLRWYFLLDLENKLNQYFFMNFATIAIITIVSTLFFYMIFLVLGVGGIAKNRRAQGLDQSKGSDN